MTEASDARRGERNHNPCNLRYDPGIRWQGLDHPPADDHGLCRFVDDEHGLRAGARDIHVKWATHGWRTVSEIIDHYAPPNENDTGAYIAFVCRRLGVAADAPLDLGDPTVLGQFVTAIVTEEEGRDIYADALIARAVADALDLPAPA